MNQKQRFKELLRIEFSPNRFLVISRTLDNKISIAQQIRIKDEDGREQMFFLKNSFLLSIIKFKEVKEKIGNLKEIKEIKENEKKL